MAQKIINVQDVFITQNAGHLLALPRETYQVPACTIIGNIGMSPGNPDGRKVTPHKTNMGFTAGKPRENLHKTWRKWVKDQMTARNFVLVNDKPASDPDADFLQMYTGMRAVSPAREVVDTAVAGNNEAHIKVVEEALVD